MGEVALEAKKLELKKLKTRGCIVFWFTLALVVVFLLLPGLVKWCPWIRRMVADFMSGLEKETYKGEFIGAVGGLLGGFLAVFGSVWLQNRAERKNREAFIKKSATIIYFDFDFFFLENRGFLCAVHRICKKKHLNKLTKNSCKATAGRQHLVSELGLDAGLYSAFCRHRHTVSIDPQWISNVAELTAMFPYEAIQSLYRVYGNIAGLAELMNGQNVVEMTANDLAQIDELAKKLGIFQQNGDKGCCYKRNKELDELMWLLQQALTD